MNKDELLAYAYIKLRESGLGLQNDFSVIGKIQDNEITLTEQIDEHFNG